MNLFSLPAISGCFRLSATLTALALLGACASTGTADLPATSADGLVLVEGTRAKAVYKAPGADFSQFNQMYIANVEVAFRKNWLKDQNQSSASISRRLSQEDADRIKQAVATEFKTILTDELQKGGYPVVDQIDPNTPNDDVLLLMPAIVNLDVAAPDTSSPGRSRTYTTSAASMALYMEFHDAITGALLGRVVDSQSSPDRGYMTVTNSVTNRAEAERMLRKWARLLVERLDKIHGK